MTSEERDDVNDSQALTRVKRTGRHLVGKPRTECWFRWQQSGELEAYSDADWRGDKSTRRSVSAGVIMRGGQCLTVWTKKQQEVSLSTAESQLYAAVKIWGIQSAAKDLGVVCGLEPTSGCRSDDVPCQPQRIRQSETCRHAEQVVEDWARTRRTCKTCGHRRHPSQKASSRRKSRHEREPRRLGDEPDVRFWWEV